MINISALGSANNGNVSVGNFMLDASAAAAGSLLIATIECRETESIAAPAGWTLLASIIGNGINSTDPRLSIYTKTAAASETAYTWTFSAGTYGSAALIEVTGADAASLIYEQALGEGVNTDSFSVPSVTTQFDGSAAIAVAGICESGYTYPFTPPAGYTEVIDAGGDGATIGRRGGIGIAWREYALAGATGAVTYAQESANTVQWAVAHIAVAPAGSVVDDPPAIPTGLSALGGSTVVTLTWNDNAETDLHPTQPYDYRMATMANMSNAGAPVVATESEAIVAGLANGTTYWFQVRARDAAGQTSNWSAAVSATPTQPILSGSWGIDMGLS